MDYDEVLEREMAPGRVDERLDRLGEEVGNYDESPPPHDRCQDIRSRFLEVTKPQPVLQQPLLNYSNAPLRGNRESVFTSLLSAPAHKFTDLPLDVFLEVAPHLYPLDVINLSRTSKPLRSLLMSRGSRPIWTTALGNIVELPPCPTDMSEPLYAALVFDHHCFACSVSDAFSVDYALRVRMCERCFKENVVEGAGVLQSLPSDYREMVGNVVLMLVPSMNTFNFRKPGAAIHRINPLSHLVQDSYFKPDLEAIIRLFWPLPNLEIVVELRSFIRARVNYVMKRQAHAVLVHGWDTVHCTVGEHADQLDLYSKFKALFRNVDDLQLRGHNWDEATSDLDQAFFDYLGGEAPQSHPASPLEYDLPKSHDQLVVEMRLRKERESDARDARICARYAKLDYWYDCAVDNRVNCDECPNLYDARKIWDDLVLADDARWPFDDNIIMNDFELLGADQSLEDYPQDVVKSLGKALEAPKLRRAEMAAHGEPEDSEGKRGRRGGGKGKGKKAWRPEDPETAVRRPTALFRCMKCGDCPYAWPGINVHWREKHRDESVWDDEGEFKAEVWEVGVEVVETVLGALVEHGLGTRDRGRMSLDDLIEDGRVFCACGDPGMAAPDNGLNWVALVKHVFGHLNENARRTLTPPARLESEEEESPVWIDDHELASCIKYLPRGADTSQAPWRVYADPDTRARINACLSQCPDNSRPMCCLCDALTPDDKKNITLFLPEGADGVLYHMQAKHGQDFQEKNIVFREESALELESRSNIHWHDPGTFPSNA